MIIHADFNGAKIKGWVIGSGRSADEYLISESPRGVDIILDRLDEVYDPDRVPMRAINVPYRDASWVRAFVEKGVCHRDNRTHYKMCRMGMFGSVTATRISEAYYPDVVASMVVDRLIELEILREVSKASGMLALIRRDLEAWSAAAMLALED